MNYETLSFIIKKKFVKINILKVLFDFSQNDVGTYVVKFIIILMIFNKKYIIY